MSAATGTKIFGVRLGIDPKFLVGGILALAVLLFWYNSRGDSEDTGAPAPSVRHVAPTTAVMPKSHVLASRRGTVSSERGALRLRPVDATRGDVDPTLRLDLLERLQRVDEVPGGRSLFDLGPAPAQLGGNLPPVHGPLIPPKTIGPTMPVTPVATGPAALNIPLKFYGYVKPMDKRETSRGFFMDGDNVLVATEGEVLKQKYRVLELNAKSARLEDIQLKQQETLPVEPEAVAQ